MAIPLHDHRLLRAHADFERAAADRVRPGLLLVGVLRGVLAVTTTGLAARRTPDPIDLRPRILQR